MSTEYIHQSITVFPSVRINATTEKYLLHEEPDAEASVWSTLSFYLGERWLSRINYPQESARALLDSGMFDGPVNVAFLAQKDLHGPACLCIPSPCPAKTWDRGGEFPQQFLKSRFRTVLQRKWVRIG